MKHLLTGSFEFRLDEEATQIEWTDLEESLRSELTKDKEFTPENCKIYRSGLAAFETRFSGDSKCDWGNVSRVCVEVKLGSKEMAIFGISPRDSKVGNVPESEMGFVAGLEGEAKLFDVLRMKLNLGHNTKRLARADRYAVLSSFVKRSAQWVYSTGWDKKNLDMFMYVAVPNLTKKEHRYLSTTVHALRKKNIIIRSVSLLSRKVALPA